MKTNSRMRALISGNLLDPVASSLPDEIQDICERGWEIGPGDSVVLRALWGPGWRTAISPEEVGAYEYEVNDVSIPLADLRTDMAEYLPRAAGRGIHFARLMLKKSDELMLPNELVATVGVSVDVDDEDFLLQGVVVRFFTERGDFPRWFDDLEKFQSEAIAVLRSGEGS